MRRILLPALASVALAGCESEADVAAEMELALAEANEAMVAVLLSAELFHQVHVPADTALRHGPLCGCPCTERVDGAGASFVLTLDYAEYGCLPESQLLPSVVAGHAIVRSDGDTCELSWDRFALGDGHAVSGDLTGRSDVDFVAPTGTLVVGDWEAALDLEIQLSDDALVIDGDVTPAAAADGEEPRTVRFDGARLPRAAIFAQCPTPDDGQARLLHPKKEKKDAVVRFAHPGDGQVTVVRDDRVSAPTDWCGYASDLW